MKIMEKPILERCPFCGYHADLEWDSDDIWVECRGCFAKGPAYSRNISDASSKVDAMVKAVNGWNKRDDGKRMSAEEAQKKLVDKILNKEISSV